MTVWGRAMPLVSLLAALAGAACTVSAGQHGRLGFSYSTGDELLPASMELGIAAGEDIDVVVFAAREPDGKPKVSAFDRSRLWRGSVLEQAIIRAESTDSNVLAVGAIDGSRVRVRAGRSGTAELTVHTARGSDTIAIEVARVGHVEIRHWAWELAPQLGPARTVLVRGGTAHFAIRRIAADGSPLTGYGVADSVALGPPGVASIVRSDRDAQHLRLRILASGSGAVADRLTLTPVGGTGLSFEVIEATDVARLTIVGAVLDQPEPDPQQSVGDERFVQVFAFTRDGRRVLGLDGSVRVEAAPAEICRIRSVSTVLGDGHFLVRAEAPGACVVTARIGRESVTKTLTVNARR